MNDTSLRDAALERLLTVELCAVMAAPPAATRAGRRQSLVAAAIVLSGALAVLGVALFARGGSTDTAQQPVFDPIDPDYEQEWPWRGRLTMLLHMPLADATTAADWCAVRLEKAEPPKLAAVLDRPAVRRLSLNWTGDRGAADVAPALWQRIATRPELEVLELSCFSLPPERLRELRLAPALHSLHIFDTKPLGEATARALVELPRLRTLMLGLQVTPAAVAVLAGLPHLETLLLSAPEGDPTLSAMIVALHELRSLRALHLNGAFAVDPADVRELAKLPHLRALELTLFRPLDGAVLDALPPQLERLTLPNVDPCQPSELAGLRRLRQLRTLRIRGALPIPLQLELPGLLRALPLERFDLLDEPDAATWVALQCLPRLRCLVVYPHSVEQCVAGARDCAQLEVLRLGVKQPPTPEQLAPLRAHLKLQRIELRLLDPELPLPTAEQLAALRAAVTAQVEVIPL